MRDEKEQADADMPNGMAAEKATDIPTRRAMLRIGALGAAAVVTVKPGMAQAASSALTCSIPVPQTSQPNKWIRNNGNVVNPNTANSYPPPSAPLPGEQVKNSLKYGTTYPGYNAQKTSAYNEYIKKLTIGKQGYTCYASLQSPDRQ